MADAATVSVLIQARDNASREFKNVESNMGKMVQGIQQHRRAIGLAMTAMGAAITGIAVMSVKSAFDQEKGIRQLDAAMQQVGTSYEKQEAQIESLVAAQQNKTNFGDEEQRDALRELILVSGNYDDAMAAMIPTMELAAGKEMDLSAAATLVARAISGEETALGRYGVEVEKGAGATEVLTAIMGKFQGQAEAAADPMTQLKNRAGDLFQVFGTALLPVIETLIPLIERMVIRIIEWTEAHPNLTKVLGIVVAALGAIMLVLGPLLLILPTLVAGIGLLSVAFGILSASMGPITLVIIAIAALVAGAIIVFKKWDDMTTKVKIAVVLLALALGPVTAAIVIGIAVWKNWDKIVEIVRQGIGIFVKQVIGFIIKLGEGFLALTKWIPGMGDARRAIEGTMNTLRDAQDTVEEWGTATQRKTREAAESWDAVEDTHRSTADAIKIQNDAMAESTGEMAQKMATAYDEVGDAAVKAEKIVVLSLEEIAASQWEFADSTALWASTAIQFNEDVLKSTRERQAEEIRIIRERRKEEARTAQAITDSWAKAAADQNPILLQMQNDRLDFGDIVEELAIKHGVELKKMEANLMDAQVIHGDMSSLMASSWGSGVDSVLLDAARMSNGVIAEQERMAREVIAEQKRMGRERAKIQGASLSELERMIETSNARILDERQKERLMGHGLEDLMGALGSGAMVSPDVMKRIEQKAGGGAAAASSVDVNKFSNPQFAGTGFAGQTAVGVSSYLSHSNLADLVKGGATAIVKGDQINIQTPFGSVGTGLQDFLNAGGVIPQKLQGGGWAGGLALVGERGPELVNLPGGSYVNPHGSGGMGGGGMGTTNNFHFHGSVYGVEDLKEAVVEAVRDHAISGGFSGVFAEA